MINLDERKLEEWEKEELENLKKELDGPLKKEAELKREIAKLELREKVLSAITFAPLKNTHYVNNAIGNIKINIDKIKKELMGLKKNEEYNFSREIVEHIDSFKNKWS